MPKYLDNDGLLYFWQKIKNTFAAKGESIKNITRNGTTFTATRADGTTFTFTQQDNMVAKTTTTPKANGTAAVGSETKYAAGDHVHPLQTTVSGNAGTATKLRTAQTIDGVSFDGSGAIIHYGTSGTVAGTAAKVVNCTGFTLVAGAWIAVKFTVTNSAAVAGLQLNVNNTGAKSIKYRGGNLPAVGTLAANRTYLFVYDGTNYELIGDLDTNTNTWNANAKDTAGYVAAPTSSNANKAWATDVDGNPSWIDVLEPLHLAYGIDKENKVTVILTRDYVDGSGISQSETLGTVKLPEVSSKSNGLMSITDKSKLDGIATGANKYTHPTYTAHATSAIYKFTNDNTGHVNAATAATASDIVSLLGTTAVNRATADASGNNIANTYAKKTDIAGMYKYKGSVASADNLPTSGQTTGDVYNIETASTYGAAGANVAWNGSKWDSLGEIFSIASITNSEIDTIVAS